MSLDPFFKISLKTVALYLKNLGQECSNISQKSSSVWYKSSSIEVGVLWVILFLTFQTVKWLYYFHK